MEKWISAYLELFELKPDMGEVEWRKEMIPLLIEKGLGYSNRNIRFEKDRTDVIILDDNGIQHIILETKSDEGKLGRRTLKQAQAYLRGGESYIVLASKYLWRVFRPDSAIPLGEIRFDEDGLDNEALFRRLSREFMQDNHRFADFRAGSAAAAYIPIDDKGFPKLIDALKWSLDSLYDYARVVWPRQVQLYAEYAEKKQHLDDTIESVKRSGERNFQIAEKLQILEDYGHKLNVEYAVPREAHQSFEIFKRIQPYSGAADANKILDIYLREACHLFLDRALLIRALEDKQVLKRKLSNGGIRHWRDLTTHLESQYQALLKFACWDTEQLYQHFFAEGAYDWYMKVNGELGGITEKVLFLLNAFDFSNLSLDFNLIKSGLIFTRQHLSNHSSSQLTLDRQHYDSPI